MTWEQAHSEARRLAETTPDPEMARVYRELTEALAVRKVLTSR